MVSVFSTPLCLTVDTCSENFTRRRVFMIVSVFSAMLGSTLDTCSLVRCTQSRAGSTVGTFVFAAPVAEPTVMLFTVPFEWLYHHCHCNCRDLVLFVSRLP